MKTTVHIPDSLLEEVRKIASRDFSRFSGLRIRNSLID
jgi:hypothetical protein